LRRRGSLAIKSLRFLERVRPRLSRRGPADARAAMGRATSNRLAPCEGAPPEEEHRRLIEKGNTLLPRKGGGFRFYVAATGMPRAPSS
jgi:hypothetical protein